MWMRDQVCHHAAEDLLRPLEGEDDCVPRQSIEDHLDRYCNWCSPEGQIELPDDTHAVVLAAKDEAELHLLELRLLEYKIPHKAIREPDAPWNGALMAIGIVPVADRQPLRPLLGRLPLLR